MVKIDKKIINQEVISTEEVAKLPVPVKTELPRPRYLDGTYKLKSHHYKHAFYVTLNYLEGKYHEIFINTANKDMWLLNALTRNWSALMRTGEDISFMINEMFDVADPKGFHRSYNPDPTAKKPSHDSIVAEIGYILKTEEPDRLQNETKTLHEVREEISEEAIQPELPGIDEPHLEDGQYIDEPCPECSNTVWRIVDSCPRCEGIDGCGFSKCG